MNRTISLLILPAFLGCAVNNTVASDDQTPEEQLSTELSGRCADICGWVTQCTPPPCHCTGDSCGCAQKVDPSTCPADCENSLAAYAGKGDACASAGLSILTCLSSASCANAFQPDLCQPDAATRATCTSDSSSNSSPSGASSSSGVAGSSSVAGSGGAGVTGAPVTCQVGAGGGVAGSANSGGSFVSCEQFSSECSDGHSYDAVCVVDSQNVSACSCLVDDLAQTTFTPSVTCPSGTEFNARCGWSLVQ